MAGSWLTDLSADVLKVPHHGSTSSSSAEFVLRIQPEYAVFTAGADNKYGHPNGEVVAFYRSIDSEVLMTMNCGDIVFVTDGNEIRYATASGQKGAA